MFIVAAGFSERLLHHTMPLQVCNKSDRNKKGEEVVFNRNVPTCMCF